MYTFGLVSFADINLIFSCPFSSVKDDREMKGKASDL